MHAFVGHERAYAGIRHPQRTFFVVPPQGLPPHEAPRGVYGSLSSGGGSRRGSVKREACGRPRRWPFSRNCGHRGRDSIRIGSCLATCRVCACARGRCVPLGCRARAGLGRTAPRARELRGTKRHARPLDGGLMRTANSSAARRRAESRYRRVRRVTALIGDTRGRLSAASTRAQLSTLSRDLSGRVITGAASGQGTRQRGSP